MDLGEGWNHVVQGGRVVKATTTPPTNPHPIPPPQPVTEAPEQPIVTATRETARSQKPEPKSTAAPKRTAGKTKKMSAASVKPTPPNLVSPPKLRTPRILRSPRSPSPPIMFGAHSSAPNVHRLPHHRVNSPRAILKTVILFLAEYGTTPQEDVTA